MISRKQEDLNAPIEEGHISAGMMHLANASYRLGRTIHFDPETQQAIGDAEANALLRDGPRGYRKPFAVPRKCDRQVKIGLYLFPPLIQE